MKRQSLIVALYLLLRYALSASNRNPNQAVQLCTDPSCNVFPTYTYLPYMAPTWLSMYPQAILVVTDISNYWSDNSQVCDIDVRFANTTCSDYFCGDGSAINATQFGLDNQIYRHNSYRDYCMYCNTTDRIKFYQLSSAGQCPYLWRHNPNICQEAGVINTVATMDTSMKQANLYLNYRKTKDPTLSLDLNNFNDVLALTVIRNAYDDHQGEIDRGEFIYLCYCSTFNRYGSRCDAYTRLVVPYNNEVLPYLFAVFFALGAAFFFFIILVPLLVKNLTFGMGKSASQAVTQTVRNMNVWTAFYVFISMVCVALTQFLVHVQYSASVAGTVFSIISFISLGLAIGHMLVFWSHVYQSSCEMRIVDDMRLSKKNTLILTLFYITLIGMLIFAIIGFIVYEVLLANNSPSSYNFYAYFDMLLYLVVVIFLLGFSIGFFFYGFKMYSELKKVDRDISLFSLRFTKIMIGVTATFIHFGIWVIILVVCTAPQMVMGAFLTMYITYFLHISMLISHLAMAFALFSATNVKKTYDCFRQGEKG